MSAGKHYVIEIVPPEECMTRMVRWSNHCPDQWHCSADLARYAYESIPQKEVSDSFAAEGCGNSDNGDVTRVEKRPERPRSEVAESGEIPYPVLGNADLPGILGVELVNKVVNLDLVWGATSAPEGGQC